MKRHILFFILLGFFGSNLSSQQVAIDSLKNNINIQSNDTVKLKSLKKISRIFLPDQTDSALYYAQTMLALAEEKQILYYISDAYDLISNVYEQKGELANCVNSIDSAKHYADLIEDPVGVMYFATNEGSIYIKMGRYFEALQSFEEVRDIGKRINRPGRVAAALNNIGAVYHYLGDDETSLDYFIQSYELRLKNNLTEKLGYSLNNIGAVYSKYGNYAEALDYHQKALNISDSLNDGYNYLVALINIGLDYDFLNDFQLSLKYYEKALDVSIDQGDKTSQAHVLERMSSIYAEEDDFESAKPLLKKALELSKLSGNNFDIASFSNSLGIIYLKENNFKQALPLFNEALNDAKEISASKIVSDVYKSLTAYYYSTNNSEQAFIYQKLSDAIKDSLYNAETEIKIANLKNRFELNQKLKELKQKDIELKSTRKVSGERLQVIYFIGIAGLVFLALAVYILVLYRKIKRKNQLISQNEKKVKELLEKEKELGKLKTQLISTVSHEFRTPMAIISSNAQMLRDYNSSMDNEMRKETLKFIQSGVENMTSMMQNFEVLDKNTILEFNPEKFDLSEFLTNIANELQSLPVYNNRIVISNNLSIRNVVMDKGLITHIVRNLLINALKFSVNKQVKFDFENNAYNVVITIVDQGIGMSKEDVLKIFENFHRGENVENIKGTGVGMSVVKRCVDLHGGQINVESKQGIGTTIKVTLPFDK